MTHPGHYVVAAVVTVQCPRCGQPQDIRETERSVGVVEFLGVCGTSVPGGGYCSTTLRLSAAAHVFAESSVASRPN